MSSLKDMISQDTSMFFNLDEFAETHNIDGRPLNIVTDNDQLMQRMQKEYDGIMIGEILFYVLAADYGEKPHVDDVINLDNKPMRVFDVREDAGIYEIILRGDQV